MLWPSLEKIDIIDIEKLCLNKRLRYEIYYWTGHRSDDYFRFCFRIVGLGKQR